MIKKAAAAVLCLWLFFPGGLAAEDEYVDVFIGTLEIREGRPYLVRCDLVKNTYLLLNKKGTRDISLKKLAEIGVGERKRMQAHVWGDPEIVGNDLNNVTLKVHAIENIRPGTCHLSDLLEDRIEAEERR